MAKTEKIEKIKDRPKTSLKVDLLENRSEEDLDMTRFKNHRRSNFGMDFIDIRKEIMAEMKSTNMMGVIKLKQSLSQRNVQQMKTKNLAASVGGGFLRNIST